MAGDTGGGFRPLDPPKKLKGGGFPFRGKTVPQIPPQGIGRKEESVQVGEFCNREVVVAGREITVADAAKLMRRHHVGDIVIVENEEGPPVPVGILTDRDIVVELLANDVDVRILTLGEVMTFDLITVREDEDIFRALKQMKNHGVRRIPVVDGQRKLAGILAVDDLIELIAEQLGDLITLFRRQELREKEQRS